MKNLIKFYRQYESLFYVMLFFYLLPCVFLLLVMFNFFLE